MRIKFFQTAEQNGNFLFFFSVFEGDEIETLLKHPEVPILPLI